MNPLNFCAPSKYDRENKLKLFIEKVIVVLLSLYKQRKKQMETLSPNKIKKLFEETLVDMLNNRKKFISLYLKQWRTSVFPVQLMKDVKINTLMREKSLKH